jgi:hypothetical protein
VAVDWALNKTDFENRKIRAEQEAAGGEGK